MTSRAHQLLTLGQSVWLDFIRRGHLVSGEFDALVRDAGVVGVTSNPTIFQQAIAKSTDYDEALAARIATGLEGEPLFESLAIEDIQMACDRLRPLYDSSKGLDGRVSIEVSPRLAQDGPGTFAAAKRLHGAVGRDNVMVKIPATKAGLPAITSAIAAGISINVTLIFSLARYREVMEAYLTGLEQLAAAGGDLAKVRSVASFFVSRVDSKVDAAIDARAATLPAGSTERLELESLRGKAAVANARLAYAEFEKVFGAPRFAALQAKGAHAQRPLWASTSTKNPAYRDVLYVEELIGPNTVNTIPPATLDAFNDHGVVESRIHRDMDAARALFGRLAALGVPVEALIDQLEDEGVKSFAKSYDDLLATLETRRAAMAAGGGAAS
jgi:transaldolase